MHPAELREFGLMRVRDTAFSAVQKLWLRRKDEGLTQKDLASRLGRDRGWVSKNLRGPGNWTFRIFGEFVQALDGEAEIEVFALEDPVSNPQNFNAYEKYAKTPVAFKPTLSPAADVAVARWRSSGDGLVIDGPTTASKSNVFHVYEIKVKQS
jgi:transcriptional regulator with XRE-family HTH domain